MNKEEYQDYKLEIEELTELLNTEWLDLKNLILSKNINLSNTLLVGYYEDEEGVEYGLLYNKNENFIIKFEILDNIITLFKINSINDISNEFPQILVAIEL